MARQTQDIITIPFVFIPDGEVLSAQMQKRIDGFTDLITIRGVWSYEELDDAGSTAMCLLNYESEPPNLSLFAINKPHNLFPNTKVFPPGFPLLTLIAADSDPRPPEEGESRRERPGEGEILNEPLRIARQSYFIQQEAIRKLEPRNPFAYSIEGPNWTPTLEQLEAIYNEEALVLQRAAARQSFERVIEEKLGKAERDRLDSIITANGGAFSRELLERARNSETSAQDRDLLEKAIEEYDQLAVPQYERGLPVPEGQKDDVSPYFGQHVYTEAQANRLPGPNRGMIYIREPLRGSPAGVQFQLEAPGSFVDSTGGYAIVPALRYDNPNPRGRNYVKFDNLVISESDLEELPWRGSIVLRDAKLKATVWRGADRDTLATLERVQKAIDQNPGFTVQYEFPNQAELDKFTEFLKNSDFNDSRIIPVVRNKP